ncbi:MAG: hypothetical protein K2O70_02710 [Desulfovibrionaceae bacterium]|nr:hypothetical protein [Desulfovibrionaceae bacterium]
MYHAIMTAFAHLRIPSSTFMGWLNADDWLFPDALSTIASIGEQYPHVDWISGWQCNFDAQGRLVNMERTRRYPQQIVAHGLADGIHWPFLQQESTFWRKKLWDTAGGLDSTFKLAGDWDLWRRFAQKAPLYHVEKQLGSFWRRPGQKSADMGAYRKEMDIVCSTEERRKAFATLLRARDGALSAIPSLRQDDQGVWREYRRTPSWKRRWELFGYSVLPIPAVRNAILGRLHN